MHLQNTYLESTVLIKFFTREPPAAAILMRIVTTTIDYVDTKRVIPVFDLELWDCWLLYISLNYKIKFGVCCVLRLFHSLK